LLLIANNYNELVILRNLLELFTELSKTGVSIATGYTDSVPQLPDRLWDPLSLVSNTY
jgi:hypothetical protein